MGLHPTWSGLVWPQAWSVPVSGSCFPVPKVLLAAGSPCCCRSLCPARRNSGRVWVAVVNEGMDGKKKDRRADLVAAAELSLDASLAWASRVRRLWYPSAWVSRCCFFVLRPALVCCGYTKLGLRLSDGWLREARSKTGRAFFQSRGQGIGCVARVELRASWDICRVASERACFARMGGVVRRQHCVAQNPPPPVGYSKARSGMGGKVHTDRRTALSHEKEQGLGEFRPIRALLAV